MNNSIKAYLNNNWNLVKVEYLTDNSCYWWKEYINFNVFLYYGTYSHNNIDIIDHDRENVMPKRPNGYEHYFKKYKDWKNFDFKQFKLMMNDLELYDKKLSIKKKLNRMKKDF